MRRSPIATLLSTFASCAVIAGCAVAMSGCGDAVAKAKSAPGSPASTAGTAGAETRVAETPVAIAAATRATVVGALERPASLRRFFESVARLEAGQAQEDVRIVQFGDSHTAADIETAVIRRALQGRFGDGGRGFVAIGKPWKGYLQEGVRCGMSTAISTLPPVTVSGRVESVRMSICCTTLASAIAAT